MSDIEDWLDEQLLQDDVSERGWKRRAVGMSQSDAIMGIPKVGQIMFKMPMENHRAFVEFTKARSTPHGVYVRRAVGKQLAEDGYPPHLLEAWLK